MVSREEFSMFSWSAEIPLCDDLWLGMQVRNIAIVDMMVVREIEKENLDGYVENDKPTMHVIMLLSAVSQMWLFSLYEFMRTWREKAKHIISTAEEYRSVLPRKRAKFLETVLTNAEGKLKFVKVAPNFYGRQLAKITDDAFVASVQKYFDDTDGLFHQVEEVRMSLAKHEVARKRGFAAEAPGYGRMSYYTGAIYWQYMTKYGSLEKADRREISNAFLGITGEITGPE
jgi:hypothetical protein